jgi:alkyl sulfatase BDS1-like metallo-beta-lactamase superfamily hydrolase
MNRGLRPDELVEQVALPDELAQNPFLREYYGTVEWSVRTIYSYFLGWFDGNATNLFPISGTERAERIVRLAGGVDRLVREGSEAFEDEDYQWTAEVMDHVLALDPENREALSLKAGALEALAELQISANARNWYLTSAAALRIRAAVN